MGVFVFPVYVTSVLSHTTTKRERIQEQIDEKCVYSTKYLWEVQSSTGVYIYIGRWGSFSPKYSCLSSDTKMDASSACTQESTCFKQVDSWVQFLESSKLLLIIHHEAI